MASGWKCRNGLGGIARNPAPTHDPPRAAVEEAPVSPKDVLATAYHLLGIDPTTAVHDRRGRPFPVAGEGKVRPELLA